MIIKEGIASDHTVGNRHCGIQLWDRLQHNQEQSVQDCKAVRAAEEHREICDPILHQAWKGLQQHCGQKTLEEARLFCL